MSEIDKRRRVEDVTLKPFYFESTHPKGLFITIEGIDGSGKSTLVKNLERHYRDKGHEVVVVREPGGTPLGEKIRDILKNPDYKLNTDQELLLFYASRMALVEDVIIPALQEDKIVICDRFFHSSFAMQYWAGNCDQALFNHLTNQIVQHVNPDITLFLDIPLDVASQRRKRVGEVDTFDDRDDVYHEKVREGFLVLDHHYDDRYQILQVRKSETPTHVLENAIKLLDPFVNDMERKARNGPFMSFLLGFLNTVIP